MSLLKAINFFPYNSWWRLGGKPELKSKFGGVCTLVILVLVGLIFTFKLLEVFNKSKMTVSQSFQQQTIKHDQAYSLTTYQNDSSLFPFMVAIDLSYWSYRNSSLTSRDFSVYGQAYKKNQSSNKFDLKQFQLQKCTVDHFSKVANQTYQQVAGKNLLCFPINQNYSFGYDYKSKIQILCQTDACKQNNQTLTFYYYVLQSAANPYNDTSPVTNYISQQSVFFISNTHQVSTINLDFNNIITDNSLLPLQSNIQQKTFYSFNQNTQSYAYSCSPCSAYSDVYIYRSRMTYTYHRTYQKVLDAVSYIGGIFQSILALFIFVQLFNASYFQMKFAHLYFRCKEAKEFYFWSFLKQLVYNTLYRTRFQPSWKEAEVRRKVTEAVVSLQDIIYINRRIEFLQKTTNILFQKHQIKGLQLLQNKSPQEIVSDYKKKIFRDKLIYFLKRNKVNQNQSSIPLKSSKNSIQLYEEGQVTSKISNKQRIGEPAGGQNRISQFPRIQIKLEVQKHLGAKNTQTELKPIIESLPSSEAIIISQQVRQNNGFGPQINAHSILDQINEEELMEYKNEEEDNLLIQEIEGDLKRLVSDAQKPSGDQRSKRICEQIDGQLREKLKAAIIQFDKDPGYRNLAPMTNVLMSQGIYRKLVYF